MTTSLAAARRPRPSHHDLTTRLHRASVAKHADAYADIAWDAHPIDPGDPRFELGDQQGLGRTRWYRELPAPRRARLGLHCAVAQLRLGMDFESILSRGLLELAYDQEPGSPDLRYAYQEVIEETQHSLMFQELIARSGLPSRGLAGLERLLARRIPRLARTFPAMFFVHVLGGEAPIDHHQRVELRRGEALHPLFHQVMRIHVMEEARHISYAESYLRAHVPTLGWWARAQLEVHTPFVLAAMVEQMIVPPSWVLDHHDVPRDVRAELRACPHARESVIEGLESVRALLTDVGILRPRSLPLWRLLGVAPPLTARRMLASG